MKQVDILVVGGGIVGLATAWQAAQRFPAKRVGLIEKEDQLAAHQSGHNSGVLHSGVYYKPGSLKARNCRAGKVTMEAFCREHEIAYELCGKVIVATSEAELPRLQTLCERAQANGVSCELIGPARLREIEPHAAGLKALHVPETGIVDFVGVCEKLGALLREAGHSVQTGCCLLKIRRDGSGVLAETTRGEIEAKVLVNCAGLHSDRVTALTQKPAVRIVPFRGEYYALKPEAHHLCRNLIYPVPDPAFPFLGVHLTRMIDGSRECGPNAVLAFAREGYRKTDISLRDLADTLTYRGFLKLASRHVGMGAGEMWRSLNKGAFVRALQRLVPDIRAEHLEAVPAGIRAQAVSPDGRTVDDFLIQESERVVNVCNAPSPAATASLAIGEAIAGRLG